MPSSVGAYVVAIAVMIIDGMSPRTVIKFGLVGGSRSEEAGEKCEEYATQRAHAVRVVTHAIQRGVKASTQKAASGESA